MAALGADPLLLAVGQIQVTHGQTARGTIHETYRDQKSYAVGTLKGAKPKAPTLRLLRAYTRACESLRELQAECRELKVVCEKEFDTVGETSLVSSPGGGVNLQEASGTVIRTHANTGSPQLRVQIQNAIEQTVQVHPMIKYACKVPEVFMTAQTADIMYDRLFQLALILGTVGILTFVWNPSWCVDLAFGFFEWFSFFLGGRLISAGGRAGRNTVRYAHNVVTSSRTASGKLSARIASPQNFTDPALALDYGETFSLALMLCLSFGTGVAGTRVKWKRHVP